MDMGEKYGWLVVVRYVERRRSHNYWECRCRCGTLTIVREDRLRRGETKSCGCYRRAVLLKLSNDQSLAQMRLIPEGTVYGRWTVLSHYRTNKGIRYHVRCACGNCKTVHGRDLKSGRTTSCGCRQRQVSAEQARKNFTTHGRSNDPRHKSYLKRLRTEANRMWTQAMDDLLYEMFPACVVCGGTDHLEVDHVNPVIRGGRLEPGNVVLLCRSCNRRKGSKPLDKLTLKMRQKILSAATLFRSEWERRGAPDEPI